MHLVRLTLAASLSLVATSAWAGPPIADEIEPNDTAGTATPIASMPAILRGYVFAKGAADRDCYSFNATIGDVIYAAVNTSGAPATFDDSTLELIAADGTTVIKSDTDDGFFNAAGSVIAGAVATGTTQYLCVTRGGTLNVLSYDLYVQTFASSTTPTAESEENDNTAGADVVTAGLVSGIATDADFFSLALTAGQTAFIVLDSNPDNVAAFTANLDVNSYQGTNGSGALNTTGGVGGALFISASSRGSQNLVFSVPNSGAASDYRIAISIFNDVAATATCQTQTGTPASTAIGAAAGINTSAVTVAGLTGRVADVNVRVNMTHTESSDLEIALQAPGGAAQGLPIIDEWGDAGATELLLTFDDQAALSFFNWDNDWWVESGDSDQMNFRPKPPYRLSWLNGTNPNGSWTLSAIDDSGGNAGVFTDWAVTVCTLPDPAYSCPAFTESFNIVNTTFEADDGFAGSTPWVRGGPSDPPLDGCPTGSNCWVTGLSGSYANSLDANLDRALDLRGYVSAAQISWAQQYHMQAGDSLLATLRNGGNTVKALWEWHDGSMRWDANTKDVDVGFSTQVHDISSRLGQQDTLRFNIVSDATSATSFDGWLIDDVVVRACRPTLDLGVDTNAPATVTAGSSYTATVALTVPQTLPSPGLQRLTLTFTLQAGTTLSASQPGAPVGWSCTGTGAGPRVCSSNDGEPVDAGTVNFSFNIDTGAFTGNATVTATIAGATNNDGVPSNDTNDAVTGVQAVPTANIDLVVSNGAGPHIAGGTVTYIIDATNNGNLDANGATISDTFPLTDVMWTCATLSGTGSCPMNGNGNLSAVSVNLPQGGGVRFTVMGTLPSSQTANFSNTVTIAMPGGVTNSGETSESDSNDAVSFSRDVTITIDDLQGGVATGAITSYMITVTNTGPSDAPSVNVAATIPAQLTGAMWMCSGSGTCGSGSGNVADTANLGATESVTYVVTATVTATAPATILFTATATVANDPNTPNTDTDTTNVVEDETDLVIAKSNGTTGVTIGQTTTYTIVVENTGPSDVIGATVEDTLPATLSGATWTCAAAGGGACTMNGTGNISDLVDLPNGATVTYTLVATVDADDGQDVINTVTVATPATATDTNTANNISTDTDEASDVPVGPMPGAPNFAVALTASPQEALPLTTIILFGSISGVGEVSFELEPAIGLTVRRAPTGCTQAGAVWTCPTETLAAGDQRHYSFVTAIDAGVAVGSLLHSRAKAVHVTEDPIPADDEVYATVTVGDPFEDGMAGTTGTTGTSGPSGDEETPTDTRPGCGCTTSPADDMTGLLTCLAALFFFRRRRR